MIRDGTQALAWYGNCSFFACMNVGTLPIAPVSSLPVGGKPTWSRSLSSPDSNSIAPALDGGRASIDRISAKTADNNTNLAGSIREQGRDFSRTLRQKSTLQADCQTLDQTQLAEDSSNSGEDPSVAPASLELALRLVSNENGTEAVLNDFGQSQAAPAGELANLITASQTQVLDTVSAQPLELAIVEPEQLESQILTVEKGLVQAAEPGEELLEGISPQTRSDILPVLDTAAPQSEETATAPAPNMESVATASLTSQQNGEGLVTELPDTVTKAADGGTEPLPADATLPVSESNIAGSEPKVPDAMSSADSTIEEQTENKANIADLGQPEPATVPQKIADGDTAQARSELLQTGGQASSDDSSSDGSPKKLNVSDADVSINEVKPATSPTAESGSDPDLGQVPLQDNAHTLVTEQFVTSPQVAKNDGDVATNDFSANVAGQIQEHIQHSLQAGDRQITIHLYPPELGKVFVRFQEQDDQIVGLLEVSKAQTRYEIEQALPEIIQNLQGAGVEVKRLEVVLTEQPDQQTHKDQSLQDGLFDGSLQSQGFLSYQENPDPYLQVSDTSINMLI
ncbi:MAG: flagellar hook-length control protein FliK [Planctomycetota bacterium]